VRPAIFACIATLTLVLAACGSGQASTSSPSSTPRATVAPFATVPGATLTLTATPTPVPTPSPSPTVSPTPVLFRHPPPYKIALEAGHGGPYYWGASAYDSTGHQWIEKDLTLDLAYRVRDLLVAAGHSVVMTRSDDSTLTPFDPFDYRASVIREAQARVSLANAAAADALVSLHFNGWRDSSLGGTEAYCNPDRSFGNESCQLAWMVGQTVVFRVRQAGYQIADRGLRNDADVNGPADVEHAWLLGTNPNFQPSLMPGAIIESLFLSNPEDLAFLQEPQAMDALAAAIAEGIGHYFRWLDGEE
jgi:N-acetylmuramoyl-L-alanine amidase